MRTRSEIIKVANSEQLANARKCMIESAQKGHRAIVIQYVDGYDGSDVDGQIRHERNPYDGCPEGLLK